MKTLFTIALLSGIGSLMTACSKEAVIPTDTRDCTHDATIIGIGPCGGSGYLIALAATRDTVITYNLPEGLIKYKSGVTPASGKGDGLFAPAAFVKIKAGYAMLAKNERTFIVCLGTVNLVPFNRMTNGEEIRVVYASKAL